MESHDKLKPLDLCNSRRVSACRPTRLPAGLETVRLTGFEMSSRTFAEFTAKTTASSSLSSFTFQRATANLSKIPNAQKLIKYLFILQIYV